MQFFVFLSIATVGGAGGLIFELVLFRLLSVQLGTTHTALAVVLASYMAGLGLGTYLFGRSRFVAMSDRSVLAVSQATAGLLVLVMIPLLHIIDRLIVTAHISILLEHVIVFIVTLAPPLLIGGLIPLLYRLAWAAGTERSRAIAWIYGLNSAGGIIGVLLATFLLVPSLGVVGSSVVSAFLFFGIALMVSFVRVGEAGDGVLDQSPRHDTDSPGLSRSLLTVLAATAGFCGLALEIIWVRVLGTFLPNRIYSFGLILAIYLLGYTLGSMAAVRFTGTKRVRANLLPIIFVLLGLLSLGTVVLVHVIPEFIFSIRGAFTTSWRQIVLPPAIMSCLMVFPATFVMGLVLPVLVGLYPVTRSEIGRDIGRLFGMNIGFSVLGSLGAGFLGLPLFGAVGTTLIVAVIYTCAGLTVLLSRRQTGITSTLLLVVSGGILFVSILGLIMPDHVPKPLPVSVGREEDREDQLLFFKETAAGTITVVEDVRTRTRWSYINNSAVCGTTYDALKVVRMLAHLPLLAHPEPREVLVIGFGLGVTAGNVLTWPVDQVDCVELCPEIAEAAPLYEAFNHGVLRDSRLSLIAGDGRRWLKRTAKHYDVITCDPTHPVLGSGNLYTSEFFRLIESRLTENGVFVQYYPLRYLTTDELKQAIATFRQTFPHSSLWLGYSHAVMLGCRQPLRIDPVAWQEKLTGNPERSDLMKSSLSRPADWLGILLMGPAELAEFCGEAQPVSDMKPILEYPRFDSIHPFTWAENMQAVAAYRSYDTARNLLVSDLNDEAFFSVIERFTDAQSLFIRGNIERHRGKIDTAMDLYSQARKTNWDDTEIRTVHEYMLQLLGEQRRKSYLGSE